MSFVKKNSDYIFTFIVEFLALVAGVLVYKLAANLEGTNDFSEYAISRRTISFILPLLIMGCGVGIPRYVALAHNHKNEQDSYYMAGLILVLGFALPVSGLIYLFKEKFSFLFFGNEAYSYLIPSLLLMILGLLIHGLNYGYFRGKISMIEANVFQLINLGIAPILVFGFTNNVQEVIFYTGVFWLTISFVCSVYILLKSNWDLTNLKTQIKELLIFGSQRVPGDFALAAFLTLPVYYTTHTVHDELFTAGYVAFAMSFLNMAGAAFGPISLILLPKASMTIKNKNFDELKNQFKKITLWTLLLTSVGVLILELFTHLILSIYLGNDSAILVKTVRVTFLASFGYTLYISLRSILDAYYVKAVNTINIIISFAIFIFLLVLNHYLLKGDFIIMLYAFAFSLFILGFLTFYEVNKIIQKHTETK